MNELEALASDTELTCATCGTTFTFSLSERDFYVSKGLIHLPRHCKPCRERRKVELAGPRTTPERYAATCSACGGPTTVPFIPDPQRPTYCPGCYPKFKRK